MEEQAKGPVRRVLGALWRGVGWFRAALSNLVFLLLLVMFVAMLSVERPPAVPARAALVLDLSGRIVEQGSFVDPVARLLNGADGMERQTLLQDVIEAIRHATTDPRIEVMVLALDGLEGAGITKSREIGAAIDAFRKAGKKVIAAGDGYSQDQYLLAAHADEVWMHPMGGVEIAGLGIFRNYIAEALRKLKIDVHVFRSGTYKSAYEFLERDNMSDADRLASSELLQEIWSAWTADVSALRKLPPGAVDHYANDIDAILESHRGDAAASALEYGYVDALKTRQQMNAALVELVGADEDGRFNAVGLQDYVAAVRPVVPVHASKGKPAVGVLVASGMILDGEQPAGSVGGDTLSAAIRKAARDDDIKALVLRIDSPGGSAFASEIIRDALNDFRASGKPLVASMGSVAASGGYWIAMPADEVWASATTITGSIGVLSAFPSVSRALEDLGVHSDGVGTTAMAGGLDVTRPLSDKVGKVLALSNQHMYQRFIGIVAEGRHLEPARVAELAEGRVWTGAQALETGLVDQLGDIDAAIAAAAKRAKLETWETRWLDEPHSLRALLVARLSRASAGMLSGAFPAARELRAVMAPLDDLARLNDPRGQYALCVACRPL